jgi:thiol-disulfide isomerase/thioredoxin
MAWSLSLPAGVLLVALAATGPAETGTPIGTLRFADAEGRTIALEAPGVFYLVDFWALECKPCMEEMPELERLAKEYEPSGRFKLVSVVHGGWKGKELLDVARRTGTRVVAYSDPENWYEHLEIDGFPTKLLIRDGRILLRVRGGGPGAYDSWKRRIEPKLRDAAGSKQP